MPASPERHLNIDSRIGRWIVGLATAAVAGLLLWFGLRWERGETDMMAQTAPAAGSAVGSPDDLVPPGDMVPPDEDGPAAPPAPDASDRTTTDVIPPEEP
jgi:hypothetical protein